MKPTLALALVLLAVCAWLVLRARRSPDLTAHGGVVPQGRWLDEDGCSLVVPMAAWDGTATYNPNAHTIRVRWAPTTTEV